MSTVTYTLHVCFCFFLLVFFHAQTTPKWFFHTYIYIYIFIYIYIHGFWGGVPVTDLDLDFYISCSEEFWILIQEIVVMVIFVCFWANLFKLYGGVIFYFILFVLLSSSFYFFALLCKTFSTCNFPLFRGLGFIWFLTTLDLVVNCLFFFSWWIFVSVFFFYLYGGWILRTLDFCLIVLHKSFTLFFLIFLVLFNWVIEFGWYR